MNNLKNNDEGVLVNNIREDIFTNETLPHESALYNYALKISGNTDDAQDLVQETYYKDTSTNFRVVQIAKPGCL